MQYFYCDSGSRIPFNFSACFPHATTPLLAFPLQHLSLKLNIVSHRPYCIAWGSRLFRANTRFSLIQARRHFWAFFLRSRLSQSSSAMTSFIDENPIILANYCICALLGPELVGSLLLLISWAWGITAKVSHLCYVVSPLLLKKYFACLRPLIALPQNCFSSPWTRLRKTLS